MRVPWPKTSTSFPVQTASLSVNELVGPGGLSRRQAFRAGSYAAATATRWNVDPAGPCLLERPKRIISLPVHALARPPSFGVIGAFGSSRQLPPRGLAVVAPALATAAGATTSARASISRFIVCSFRLRLHRKISRIG